MRTQVDLNLLSDEDKDTIKIIDIALDTLKSSGRFDKELWNGLVSRKFTIIDSYRVEPEDNPEMYEPTLEERIEALETKVNELEQKLGEI